MTIVPSERDKGYSEGVADAQPDRCIMVLNDAEGVAFGGRFHGWLMRQHPDGHWVSVRKLEQVDPFDNPLGRMLKSTTE